MLKRFLTSYYWRNLYGKSLPRRAWAVLLDAFYWLFLFLLFLILARGLAVDFKGYAVALLFVLFGVSLSGRGILNRKTLWAYWAGFFGAYCMVFSLSAMQVDQMRARFYQLTNTSYALSRTESRARIGLMLSELARLKVPEKAEFFRISDTFGMMIPIFADEGKLLRAAKSEFCNIIGSRDDWDGLELHDIDMAESGFANMTLRNVGFHRCSFTDGVLSTTDFMHARFISANFGGLFPIGKCNFGGSDFFFAHFRDGFVIDSDFSASQFMEPIFLNMRMENVSFAKASFHSAVFSGSALADARFPGAVFERCSFRNAALGRVFYAPLDDAVSRLRITGGKPGDLAALERLAPTIARAVLQSGEPAARAVWDAFVKENADIFATGYWEHLWPSKARVFVPDFDGTALYECDCGSFTILDPAGTAAVTVNDDTIDQAILEQAAAIFANASTLYGTRLPKPLEAMLRRRSPSLFDEEAGRAALRDGKQARERALAGMARRLRSPLSPSAVGPQW